MPSSQPTPPTGTWLDYSGYVALRCVICFVQSLSLETCDRWCRLLAAFLADWTKLRRAPTDENLLRVYGQLTPQQQALLRRQMWHHLLLMVCEIAHAPRKIHRTNWREHFYLRDKNEMFHYMMDQRATVLVTGHFGNFEVAGYLVGMIGTPTTTIARPLDNPYVNEFFTEFRSFGGHQILPKEGSSTRVQEVLDGGGTLTLLADQHAGTRGCWVDFFGHPTSCHKALALFVLSARAPMVVNYTRRVGKPLRFEMGMVGVADPADLDAPHVPEYLESVTELTAWYNQKLEDAIRMAPEQYWWLHRRWRGIPDIQLKRLEARRQKKHS